MMYSPGGPYIMVAPVVTSWAVAGQRMVFLHMYLQTRVTLKAFPIATPRGRSVSFSTRGTMVTYVTWDVFALMISLKDNKSNQIKSLLLSHHHSTSALVSEILMSVLQTVQKNNRQFTYGQTVQKKQQTIYIWTDSAKNCTGAFTVLQTVQKKQQQQFTYGQTVQKKQQQQFTYGQTVQKKNSSNLHMNRQCKKNNSNLHMDSTYLQTVQKTMCKIHIHALSTLSVL